MFRVPALPAIAATTLLVMRAEPAGAQNRSSENAVTEAEDAFGFKVGSESLGIYDADNVRGFSPTNAGNLRVNGLYFAPVVGLSGLVVESDSIKVGLSAQGYPFAAPSGIVDLRLRRPADQPGASVITRIDSYGSASAELDSSLPVARTLGLWIGLNGGRSHFFDGTRNDYHSEALIGRWRPSRGIEILPFWSAFIDVNDNSSIFYLPEGAAIPPQPPSAWFPGPWWNVINRTHLNYGLLGSAELSSTWVLRLGVFRSLRHIRSAYTYLITDIDPTGVGDHLIFAHPPSRNSASSGELRLTHMVADGPRLHTIHFSVRARKSRFEYGGEAQVDLGRSSIRARITAPAPQFTFGQLSHDDLSQWIAGLAYDGRWKGVGELSFGVSKSSYRKRSSIPGLATTSRSSPLLYNGTLTVLPLRGLAIYAGYSRGFEESGTAPASASNRNAALPAILTSQVDAGLRLNIGANLKGIAGVFDLRRPYFGFDSSNRYVAIGTTRSRGAEFSLSGNLAHGVTLVGGGVLLDSRVKTQGAVSAAIGRRPVGLPTHIFSVDLNWQTKFAAGLSFDATLSERGETPATADNQVRIPARALLDLGAHYSFPIGHSPATVRVQLLNLFDNRGFSVEGPGVYSSNPSRSALAQLSVDL